MAGSLDLKAVPEPRWRNILGRYAKEDPKDALRQAVKTWGAETVTLLKSATPVEETGEMRRSWTSELLPAQQGVEVRNAMRYAGWVIGGTAQSTGGFIYPLHGKFLRFMAKQGPHAGHVVFMKRVRGQKPNPALNAIIDRLAGEAAVDLHQAGISVIKSLTGLEDGA